MESLGEKFMRYVRVWLLIGVMVVIGSAITYGEQLKDIFMANISTAMSGLLTICFMLFLIRYIMLGR